MARPPLVAIDVARQYGAVVWQQTVDNRGRALGDPFRLLASKSRKEHPHNTVQNYASRADTKFVFTSKFESLAEIEALRAGFKPTGVSSLFSLRLVPIVPAPREPKRHRPTGEDFDIRAEMERRCVARRSAA